MIVNVRPRVLHRLLVLVLALTVFLLMSAGVAHALTDHFHVGAWALQRCWVSGGWEAVGGLLR